MSFGRPSTTESTKSLLNWLVAGGSESPQGWLDGKRTPADIAAAWQALAARLRPRPRARPAARRGAARRSRRRPLAPESLAALPPPQAIAPAWRFSSFSAALPATRGARPPRTTTTRGSRDAREAHRRAAAGHRAGRHPALSARHQRRRVPARDLRAHRLHRRRPAGTTPSPAACPRIRNSSPACARPSNRRCSRHGRADAGTT